MKNKRTALACLGLVGILGVGGVAAYFTDSEEAVNKFTFGQIDIDVTEPNFDEDKTHENTLPNEVITKDPTITVAESSLDAYAFFEVTLPEVTAKVAGDDGTVSAEAKHPLFSYELNEGWTEIGTGTNNGDGTITHVYAYGSGSAMTALSAGESTTALFDEVKVLNFVEGSDFTQDEQNITVKGYAIQTTDIGDSTSPSAIWEFVSNQANRA